MVNLVERSTEWRAEGGGIAVQPNGIRVLRGLGLEAAVEEAGARIHRWCFCDETGEPLSEHDLSALWHDVGPFIGMERMQLSGSWSMAPRAFSAAWAPRFDR